MKMTIWASALSGILLVTGCGGTKSVDAASLITGKSFDVASIQGVAVSESDFPTKKPFINFGTDGKATGNTGCNNFNGKYSATNGKLTIDPGAMTRMACPGTGEQLFIRAIQGVDAVKRVKNNIILLQGANEMMRLIPKP